MKGMTVLLLSLVVAGCFHYSAQLTLAPVSDAQGRLNSEDVARANELVARTASEWGLVPDMRLPEIARSSREDAEWKDYVVALYSAGSQAATHNRVLLTVLVHKETGNYSVLVRDLDSVGSTKFTAAIESSLA